MPYPAFISTDRQVKGIRVSLFFLSSSFTRGGTLPFQTPIDMGWKCSLIIIHRPKLVVNDVEFLQLFGFPNLSWVGPTTLDECIYPGDKSLNIGYYNDCLVLADDYQLTEALDRVPSPGDPTDYERILTGSYPDSEILSVACHSAVNYHVYSLVKGGRKLRYKRVVDGEPLREFGTRLPEEEVVYAYSKLVDGRLLFRSTYRESDVYDMVEDQMMEAFAFGVAKRLLGVTISEDNDEELMNEVPFNKYTFEKTDIRKTQTTVAPATEEMKKRSWWKKLLG